MRRWRQSQRRLQQAQHWASLQQRAKKKKQTLQSQARWMRRSCDSLAHGEVGAADGVKIDEAHATNSAEGEEAGLMLEQRGHLLEAHGRVEVRHEQSGALLRMSGATAHPRAATTSARRTSRSSAAAARSLIR